MINAKDSLVSLIGVITGQVAIFLCVFLIGRWRGPEVLGQFNYLLALATFGGSMLAFRYELACVNDSPRESFNAFINALALCLAVVAVIVLATAVAGRPDWYVVEIYALASFVQMAAATYFNSLRWYGWIALSRVAINASFLAYLLLGFVCAPCRSGDVFEWYAGLTAVVAAAMAAAIVVSGYRAGYSFRVTRRFFVQNRRFAVYILPSTICASVVTYALSIVIPRWFDAASAGYFAAAYRLGFFPVSLIGQSLGGVFRRDALAAMARGDAGNALPRVYAVYARALAMLAALYAAAGLVLFAPLVRFFFGENWQGAIDLYYCLMPLFTLQMIYLPLAQIFLAARAQRADFLFQLTCGVCLMGALYVTKLMGLSVQASVSVFSLSGAMLMMLGIALTYRVLNVSVSRSRAAA